jgi:hypothetical protein
MHGHGSFCVDTCSLDPKKQLVAINERKEKYLRLKWQLLAFGRSLHFAGVGVSLRVVVTGHRHGWSVVRLWWFHPVRCFPAIIPSLSFPRHLPVVSRSSPHRYPLLSLHHSSLLSPCCPIILPPHRPSSSATTTRSGLSSTTRRVCHVPPRFPASYCSWRSWAWVVWYLQLSLPVV